MTQSMAFDESWCTLRFDRWWNRGRSKAPGDGGDRPDLATRSPSPSRGAPGQQLSLS